jgi:hypothetical protein
MRSVKSEKEKKQKEREERKKEREEQKEIEREEKEEKRRLREEEKEKESEKKKKVLKIGNEVILPYKGKESLPKEVLGSKGDLVKPGEPRHFVTRQGDSYKLIRVYRARGIKHALVRMIKPKKKNKPGEKELYAKLKKLGIPGAY